MITLLFDIDGTLIRTGGAGMVAIKQAMREMFGLESISKVPVHGRTDEGILTDLFAAQSLSFAEHRETFSRRYWELLPQTLLAGEGEVLPGVEALLAKLDTIPEISMGILTGNAEPAADIKLQHFGLEKYFHFGGYGDRHGDRNDVARLAQQSAEAALGEQFQADHVWVIGDTVNDVVCARSIGAKVIAVETGGGSRDVLSQSNPDCQLATLAQTEDFLKAIGA